MQDDPYADFKDEPSSNLVTILVQLADEQQEIEANIVRLEEELDLEKTKLTEMAEFRIPNVTDGLSGKFDLLDGRILTVSEKIRASIAQEKGPPAIKWLDDHGYGSIVKRQLIFEWPKDSTEQVEKFLKAIKATKIPVNMKNKHSVHHATIDAFVREKLGEGIDLPNEIFGIYTQKFSKIKGEKE